MMKYASIDIGTNTLRLLIAGLNENGSLQPVVYERAITRLGGNYREDAGIAPEAAERTLRALESFRRIIDENGVRTVWATATSVVRRAKNRDFFLCEAHRRAGVSIDVISGGEEARLSLLGVLSVITDRSERKLVIDIGGGSTEFIFTRAGARAGAWSMEMGVVHLTERHLKSDPPLKLELECLEDEIKGVLSDLKAMMNAQGVKAYEYSTFMDASLIGTAGTITTLAAIDQSLETYDREKVNNYSLSKERVRHIYYYLTGLTLAERQSVLSLEKGREDLIVSGSAIALLVMEEFAFDEIKVSDSGLLEGIILDRAPGIVKN